MENKELKYPVKYAVEELTEYGGWANSFVDITCGYITSKCYVVESTTKYYADGRQEEVYSVVFPYQDIETFKKSIEKGDNEKNIGQRRYPQFSADGSYYPIKKVTNLYNTYDEAALETNQKNERFRNDMTNPQMASYNENQIINEIGRNLAIATLYEQEVLNRTQDMIVNDEIKRY